jgi:hypothetical protein
MGLPDDVIAADRALSAVERRDRQEIARQLRESDYAPADDGTRPVSSSLEPCARQAIPR